MRSYTIRLFWLEYARLYSDPDVAFYRIFYKPLQIEALHFWGEFSRAKRSISGRINSRHFRHKILTLPHLTCEEEAAEHFCDLVFISFPIEHGSEKKTPRRP